MVEPLAGVGLAEQCHGFRWHMKEQKKNQPTTDYYVRTRSDLLGFLIFYFHRTLPKSPLLFVMPCHSKRGAKDIDKMRFGLHDDDDD